VCVRACVRACVRVCVCDLFLKALHTLHDPPPPSTILRFVDYVNPKMVVGAIVEHEGQVRIEEGREQAGPKISAPCRPDPQPPSHAMPSMLRLPFACRYSSAGELLSLAKGNGPCLLGSWSSTSPHQQERRGGAWAPGLPGAAVAWAAWLECQGRGRVPRPFQGCHSCPCTR